MSEEDKENIELYQCLAAAQNILLKKITRRKQEEEHKESGETC